MWRRVFSESRVLPRSAVLTTFIRPVCSSSAAKSSVDPDEIAKFSALAGKWWDPNGSAAPLHRLNPTRIGYIRSTIEKMVLPNRTPRIYSGDKNTKCLSGIDVVDIGCGAGLVAEPIARLGAKVLGVDMSSEGIGVARAHAVKDPAIASNDVLRYREAAVEDVLNSGEDFDVVLALEIIEHVSEPAKFLTNCASLVREGGVLILSTLNRTAASYALGIIAAEHVLGWLPPGTHDWTKFPTPEEVADIIRRETKLVPEEAVGVAYNPFRGSFSLVETTNVNYMLTASHPIKSNRNSNNQSSLQNEAAASV